VFDQELSTERRALLNEFRSFQAFAISLQSLQTSMVEKMARSFLHFNWVGFYMLDPTDDQMLVVGPYFGNPTPHVRIPVNEGICGAAVERGETVVVHDVDSDPRYLSCSIETRSEIVVPIYTGGRVVGEIDIDSHSPAAFSDDDRVFLEEVAKIVGGFIEEHPMD
jgi:GAF domain-containing protein